MTAIDPRLLEQLSAWMDGELPADEARFLQRRLQNDVALREQWERWQLASACLRGQRLRRMDGDLPDRIAAGIAGAANDPRGHRPRLGWLATAAALVLAITLVPRMTAVDPGQPAAPARSPSVVAAPAGPLLPPMADAVDVAAAAGPPMSPLPSVRDFPLVDNGGKAWPRSPLLADPRMPDRLLVRSELPWRAPVYDDRAAPRPSAGREADGE